MADTQLYSLGYCLVNSKLLTQEASITVRRSTGSQPVHTVAGGYQGESPGSSMVEIDVSNAVPAADFEMDAGAFMQSLEAVEMGVVVAGKQMVAKGYIIEDSFQHSVNAESKYDFKFRGKFQLFE